jgi:hypothetical protein
MKKLLLFLVALGFTFNVAAHCGSCGVGGSADDHADHEDKEHHDKDARFEEAKKKRDAMLEDDDEGDQEDE